MGDYKNYSGAGSFYAITDEEVSAGLTKADIFSDYPVLHVNRYGAQGDASTDDLAAIDNAILAADIATSGTTQGAQVVFGQGAYMVSGPIVVPARIKLVGSSARGTQIRATTGFTGSFVVDFVDGTAAMFDTGLRDIGINANSVTSTSCVRHNAFQENSEFINVLLNGFDTYGLELANGYGGAARAYLENIEILGLDTATGIRVSGTRQIMINGATINGNGVGDTLDASIDLIDQFSQLIGFGLHFERATDGVLLTGTEAVAIIHGIRGQTTVTNLINAGVRTQRIWATAVTLQGGTNSFSEGGSNLETDDMTTFQYPKDQTFSNDATPSVGNHCKYYTLGGTATVTQFDDALNDQEWMCIISGTGITFDFSSNANLNGNNSVDVTFSDGDAVLCKHYAGVTYCFISLN